MKIAPSVTKRRSCYGQTASMLASRLIALHAMFFGHVLAALGNEAEEYVVVASVDPGVVRERRAHATAAATA